MTSPKPKSRPPGWLRSIQLLSPIPALLLAVWEMYSQGALYSVAESIGAHTLGPDPVTVFTVMLILLLAPVHIVCALLRSQLPPATGDDPSLGDRVVAWSKSRYTSALVTLGFGVGLGIWCAVRILSAGSLAKVSCAKLSGNEPPRWGRYVEVQVDSDPDRSASAHMSTDDVEDFTVATAPHGSDQPCLVLEQSHDPLSYLAANDPLDGRKRQKGILTHRLPASVQSKLGALPDGVWVLDTTENPSELRESLPVFLAIAMLVGGVIVLAWKWLSAPPDKKRG